MQATSSSALRAQLLDTSRALPREAALAIYAGQIESLDYFQACETARAPGFGLGVASVSDGSQLAMAAPLFETSFRLDLALDGAARRVGNWLHDRAPKLVNVPIVGLGHPHMDHMGLGVATELPAAARAEAMGAMLAAVEARARIKKAHIVCLKNMDDAECEAYGPVLDQRGYTRVPVLPIARLMLPATADAYFDSLSQNMRSNMRRRLKRAKDVRVEIRTSAVGLEDQLFALREGTRKRATTDYDVFEQIAPNYFQAVLEALGDNAKLLLYWLGDRLIGFAMVVIQPTAIIEKYNGMVYPEGPDNGVFYLNWMTQVRMATELGCKELRAGETTYLIKARLGCKLHRSWVYIRHTNGVANAGIRAAKRWIRLDNADPDLKELGDAAPYAHLPVQPAA
jgi:hypothetical protein